MKKMKSSVVTLALLFVLQASVTVNAQTDRCQGKTDLTACLNERVETIGKAKIDQTSNTKQSETPSISGNTTSLVDQSSAGDLVNVGLTLAGLSATSQGEDMQPNSVSVTATAYSLYAALKGAKPLNPQFYYDNQKWRNFSITLGYDDEKIMNPDGTETTQRAKLFGAKYLFINHRDPSRSEYAGLINTVFNSTADATRSFNRIINRTRAYIFKLAKVRDNLIKPDWETFLQSRLSIATAASKNTDIDRINLLLTSSIADLFAFGEEGLPVDAKWSREEQIFYNQGFLGVYSAGPGFQRLLPFIGEQEFDDIDQFIEREIESFVELRKISINAVDAIRKASQFSLYVLTKQRMDGVDEYMAEIIYDRGISSKVNFTFNGAFEYKDSKVIGGDLRGGKFSAQLQYRLNQNNMEALMNTERPVYFYLAGEGKWMNGMDSMVKGQAKLVIPIPNTGIDFPISFTVANRTEFVDEKEVRGQFGFTFDLAKLVNAIRPK